MNSQEHWIRARDGGARRLVADATESGSLSQFAMPQSANNEPPAKQGHRELQNEWQQIKKYENANSHHIRIIERDVLVLRDNSAELYKWIVALFGMCTLQAIGLFLLWCFR